MSDKTGCILITGISFLNDHLATISVDDCVQPEYGPKSGEKIIVREIHDELKKHWHFISILESEVGLREAKLPLIRGKELAHEKRHIAVEIERAKWVGNAFWISCRLTL
jgi:hypothetical protein